MNTKIIHPVKFQIRGLILFFILALIASGATAIPAYQELQFILAHLAADNFLHHWFSKGFLMRLASTQANFPFLL